MAAEGKERYCAHITVPFLTPKQCRLGCCLAGQGRSRLFLSFVSALPFYTAGPTEQPAGES